MLNNPSNVVLKLTSNKIGKHADKDVCVFDLPLIALTKIINQTRRGDITTVKTLRSYLLNVVHALKEDTLSSDLENDVHLNIVEYSLCSVLVETQLVSAKCQIKKPQVLDYKERVTEFSKELGVSGTLPSGKTYLVIMDDKMEKCKSWFYSLRDSSEISVIFKLDIPGKKVKEIKPTNNNPMEPAITKKGAPCMDCVAAIKKHGRRCWRKQHKVQD